MWSPNYFERNIGRKRNLRFENFYHTLGETFKSKDWHNPGSRINRTVGLSEIIANVALKPSLSYNTRNLGYFNGVASALDGMTDQAPWSSGTVINKRGIVEHPGSQAHSPVQIDFDGWRLGRTRFSSNSSHVLSVTLFLISPAIHASCPPIVSNSIEGATSGQWDVHSRTFHGASAGDFNPLSGCSYVRMWCMSTWLGIFCGNNGKDVIEFLKN